MVVHECRKRRYYENNYHNNGNTNNIGSNANSSNNNSNSDNSTRDSGNRVEVSAEGTHRDQWKPRPVHSIEGMQGPSMTSEKMMGHSLPLN